MLLLTEHLPKDRFEVSFVLLGGMTDNAAEAQRLGATVHALGAPRRAGTPMPIFRCQGRPVSVAAYVALCRRERYDIVDAWLYYSYGLAAVTRPPSRVPVLIAGRRSLSGFKTEFGLLGRTVDAIARRLADVIVANSQAVADDVVRREGVDPKRIEIIRNGVVLLPPADEAHRRHGTRAHFTSLTTARSSGCVGMFKRGKGQRMVLDVMAVASQSRPDAWLVFVGDGPERISVEPAAREAGLDRVRLLGTVPDARDPSTMVSTLWCRPLTPRGYPTTYSRLLRRDARLSPRLLGELPRLSSMVRPDCSCLSATRTVSDAHSCAKSWMTRSWLSGLVGPPGSTWRRRFGLKRFVAETAGAV